MAAAVLILTPMLDALMMQRSGVSILNWLSWIFVFGAGVTLMIRHKSSWILGVVLCAAFVVNTSYHLIQEFNTVDPIISSARLLDCLIVVFIVGTVFSFFRYPYLDRRQNWFAPTGDRYVVATSVLLEGRVEAQTVDLSYTGARIAVPEGVSYQKGQTVSVQLSEINDIQCAAKVIDLQGGILRLHFADLNSSEKELLRQWLSSQNLQKT
nr:hypothetical protein BdHM001_21770 [Bdellovibrio sp. HM001]